MVRLAQSAVFVTLVALVALRPLVSETFDYRTDSISLALADLSDPTPLLTLGFDAVILLCGLAWLITRAFDAPRSYRRTGLEWGSILMTVAAVVSCATAGQKRVAITASLDWLCLPVLAITLSQLMRTRMHRRVLLAAVVASAGVQAFHAFEQYFVGFEETWSTYQAGKAAFWANQGVPLDSNRVEMFERRMLAREASGTFYHSNVAGAYLALCGIGALGLAIGHWRRRTTNDSDVALIRKIGSGVCAVVILSSVWLTGSLGAIVTGGAGVVALLIVWLRGRWIRSHRRRLFAGGWTVFLLACVAVVGHGLYHGSLPGSSLNFRWQYWVNSMGMIGDHPLTGVGRENFGNHYLAYKSIESPEEISTPHNLFVQAAGEWGLLGLVGVLMMVWGVSRVLSGAFDAHRSPGKRDVTESVTATCHPPWSTTLTLMLIGGGVVFGRLVLCGSSQYAYLYYTGVVTALAWLATAAVVMPANTSSATSGTARDLTDAAVSIGVLTFALHELVNFAIFVPGAGTTLFALVACASAYDADTTPAVGASHRVPRHRWIAPLAGALTCTAVYLVAIHPPWQASRLLQQAESRAGQLDTRSLREQAPSLLFEAAARADQLDPHPLRAWVMWLRKVAAESRHGREALAMMPMLMGDCIERDPFSATRRREQMHLYRQQAILHNDPQAWRAAADAAQSVLTLYPLNPQGLVDLGDCRRAIGQADHDGDVLAQALQVYRDALTLDDERLPWEQLHRFTPTQTAEIREKIRALERVLDHDNE